MTVVYSVCVCACMCVCLCVCALGRPLECDSRPARWQETPWRLWQAASCTPSFTFLSLSLSLTSPHYATHLSPHSSLHLLSCICIHSVQSTCLFVFLFHSSTPCFLGGSQQDLNNWTFPILYLCVYFFLSQSVDESFHLCLCLFLLLLIFSHHHSFFLSGQWRNLPLIWPVWSI